MTIQLRLSKGTPLTNEEVDANFTFLNDQVNLKLNSSAYTAADVLTKIKTVDGAGSGLDADLLDGYSTDTTNTPNTVVIRDASGDFAASTITASQFNGYLVGNVLGNVTGNVTGVASNVSGIVSIQNGGTNATTAGEARTNLGLGSMAVQNSNAVTITGGNITGITDLAVSDGGTGASSPSQARTNLGLVIGTDVQAFDADLVALSSLTGTGLIVRTAEGTATTRAISAGLGVSVTNGNAVNGDPVIAIGQAVNTNSSVTFSSVTTTGAVNVGGNLYAVGNVYAYYSDDRLKTRIGKIENPLQIVKSLDGFYYEANETAQELGYEKKREVGVSAQQVNVVMPEVIARAPVDEKYMTVQYERLVPLLIEAIKELSIKVEELSKGAK